jgi:hypothetical protein
MALPKVTRIKARFDGNAGRWKATLSLHPQIQKDEKIYGVSEWAEKITLRHAISHQLKPRYDLDGAIWDLS